MDEHSEIFVGLDVATTRHAVAVAEGGRQGEVRYFGEIDADPAAVRQMGDCPESGGQAAIAISEGALPAGSNRWPKPEPSVPL